MGPARRLLVFSLGFLALAGGSEAFVRWQHDAFSSASHRARFKAALLRRQHGLSFATVGTSRFNDGVSPALVGHGKGFSASVPSSSLAAQALLARTALSMPGMKAVFLEASLRQVAQADDPTLAAVPPEAPHGFEATALASSELLADRRVLMVDNLPRLFALWAPVDFDGSEWFRTRWLADRWEPTPATPPALPAPQVRCPGGAAAVAPAQQRALATWTSLAQEAAGRGVKLFFVVPPVAQRRLGEECTPAWSALWQTVATRTGDPVYDFSCAAVPDALFNDGQEHFGLEGRVAFSQALGGLWTQADGAPACGSAAR